MLLAVNVPYSDPLHIWITGAKKKKDFQSENFKYLLKVTLIELRYFVCSIFYWTFIKLKPWYQGQTWSCTRGNLILHIHVAILEKKISKWHCLEFRYFVGCIVLWTHSSLLKIHFHKFNFVFNFL